MRFLTLSLVLTFFGNLAMAQMVKDAATNGSQPYNTTNIYEIKKQFQYNILHNPGGENNEQEADNELTRFNRWFNFVEPRCYPSGNLPSPCALIDAWKSTKTAHRNANRTSRFVGPWQPLGPKTVAANSKGIGRINAIAINPLDTNNLFVGAACGGVFITHDGGATWISNTDNFPSLSIADIALNPIHPDTLYAATGDGYGYTTGLYNIFWGGLYSAGVMKSTDGGNSWNTTGLTYSQANTSIIQKLLIHPTKTNILLAATTSGIQRTTDAGATWTSVETGHVYSMAFYPGQPDTIYAINDHDLRVSYNTGASWSTLHAGVNPSMDRATVGVSPASPKAIWVLDASNNLQWSHDQGTTFTPTTPADTTAVFYGYYDRILAISPVDSNNIIVGGAYMAYTTNGGNVWARLDTTNVVHLDNHAITINQQHPATIYSGNDGGIYVTRNGGRTWQDLTNGLMISQIYGISSSRQRPYLMLAGLQDIGSLRYDSILWDNRYAGVDGMANAVNPINDSIMIVSSQYGTLMLSLDRGDSFTYMNVTPETGAWVTPVCFDPHNKDVIYCGYHNIYRSTDRGLTYTNITGTNPFPNGAIAMAVSPSDSNVIYAADFNRIMRTTNHGTTWTNVTGSGLAVGTAAITNLAIDYTNPMLVYVTMSGYASGKKVYMSNVGGSSWTNISYNLPNLPTTCIITDSSAPGALYVGTDIGVYYTDSTTPGVWAPYSSGLPNVIASCMELNYKNNKIRVATYGRGIWECAIKGKTDGINTINNTATTSKISLTPNPTDHQWVLIFNGSKPDNYSVTLSDISGKVLNTYRNSEIINATNLVPGIYNIEVIIDNQQYSLKAIRK